MNFRDCFGGNAGTDVAQPLWASSTSPLALQLIRFLSNNTPRPAELFDWLLNSRQTFVFFYLHISVQLGVQESDFLLFLPVPSLPQRLRSDRILGGFCTERCS